MKVAGVVGSGRAGYFPSNDRICSTPRELGTGQCRVLTDLPGVYAGLEPNTEHEPRGENPEARTAAYAFRFEKKCRWTKSSISACIDGSIDMN